MRKVLEVRFFALSSGRELVRDWLKELSKEDRVLVGTDIRVLNYGWPIGMPVCRPLGGRLFEVRTSLRSRIARVIFFEKNGYAILLHGFIKKTQKTQKTPLTDLNLAVARFRLL